MYCEGNFKFKGILKKDAGTFKNDKGEVINYPEKYELKVDEIDEDGLINERLFKLPIDSKLIATLVTFKPYQDINLTFDVSFLKSGSVKVTPVDVSSMSK